MSTEETRQWKLVNSDATVCTALLANLWIFELAAKPAAYIYIQPLYPLKCDRSFLYILCLYVNERRSTDCSQLAIQSHTYTHYTHCKKLTHNLATNNQSSIHIVIVSSSTSMCRGISIYVYPNNSTSSVVCLYLFLLF